MSTEENNVAKLVPSDRKTDEQYAAEIRARMAPIMQAFADVKNDARAHGMDVGFNINEVWGKFVPANVAVNKIL